MSSSDRQSARRRATRRQSRVHPRFAVEALEERTMLDSAGPRIIGHAASVLGGNFVDFELTFDEPINPTTFSTGDVTIVGPTGPILTTGVALVAGNTYRISFAP